jgi:hypothetical protein
MNGLRTEVKECSEFTVISKHIGLTICLLQTTPDANFFTMQWSSSTVQQSSDDYFEDRLQIFLHIMYEILFIKSPINNMVMVRNFGVISQKFNTDRICA